MTKSYGPFLLLLIGLSAAGLMFTGCGKKGPPLPPESRVPEAVAGLTVEGGVEGLILSWRIPERNGDGSPLRDLAGFKVYRKREAGDCGGCPADFPLYMDVDMDSPEGVRVEGKRVILLDREVEEGGRYRYKVAAYNREGYFGPFSPVVNAAWTTPPLPPAHVEGTAGDRSVELVWERPPGGDDEGFAGYRVYRSGVSGSYPPVSLTESPVEKEGFIDIGLENNRQYYYVVTSLVEVEGTLVEGPPSNEVLLVPVDMIAPAAPAGLNAVPTGEGVALSWKAVEEGDPAGYNIYRRLKGALAAGKVNEEPVRGGYYLDRDVERGKSYVYSVTAVDDSLQENESAPSPEVTVRIPE